ncbi:MAG: Crp/Fnr family transcriptional regulator [bacterium]
MALTPTAEHQAEGDKLWYLKHIAIFAGMTDAEMRRLAERTVMRSYARGGVIVRPDDPPDSIYLIKKGRVKLSRYSASGREHVLALLEPGEIYGERALAGATAVHCEAFEDSLICVLSLRDFEELLRAKPDLALRVIKALAQRLRRAEEEIESFAFRDVPGRLSALLVRLAEAGADPQHQERRPTLRLTHQDLASMIGATRETVTNVLNRFRDMGLISIRRREIVIKGLQRLRRVVRKTDGAP